VWWGLPIALLCIVAAMVYVQLRVIRRPRHDLVILDATIHDGTGAPAYRGSVAVDRDRISAIYPSSFFTRPTGKKSIDARGLDVAPGFIDTHTHADQNIVSSSSLVRAPNFVGQGVTTIITGNCGRSPVHIGRFARSIAVRGSNVNVATLVGLNSIRSTVMKSSTAPASVAETAKMCELVSAAMREGALGVSTGAAYVPGRFASEAETVAQLRVAAKFGGLLATHLRDEGNEILSSVEEALRQSRQARIPLLISHFKIIGPSNCSKYQEIDRRISAAVASGIPVFSDQYPYGASSSSLDLYLPDWYLATSGAARRQILDTPDGQKRLGAFLRERIAREGFGDFGFAYVASYEQDVTLAGMNVRQIASHNGQPGTTDGQLSVLMELLRHGGAQMVYHNVCRDLALEIASRPSSMFGSDSAIRYSGGDYLPHPRGWGTFPRVFAQLVRREQVVSLDEAIRRMTSLPAKVFGLTDRGVVRVGAFADLVVFDAATIGDRATYSNPFLPPRGIVNVIVNGEVVLKPSAAATKRMRSLPDMPPVRAGRFLVRGQSDRMRAMRATMDANPPLSTASKSSTSN
jgi:N-acyl-D-amino-acid deacylase